jgi:hypothetical protein
MTIPSLAAAYLSPRYRSATATRMARLDQEPWWQEYPICDDLEAFLIGHLTSVTATENPLIVLGQPGSGKSVLTKVIAARLPARDYMAVRVELREVPADTDLQSQIEYAIRDATGESLNWPALARSAGGALPVVLLDGFDELLQATGIGQTDYLEQIVRFQEREADQGRPAVQQLRIERAFLGAARWPSGWNLSPRSRYAAGWRYGTQVMPHIWPGESCSRCQPTPYCGSWRLPASRCFCSCWLCMTLTTTLCSSVQPDSVRRTCTSGS